MSQKPKNLELSKILDLEKIRVVGNPIEKAHGLPNECYTSTDYLTIEKERIFKEKWIVVGVGSSLPNVGDANLIIY